MFEPVAIPGMFLVRPKRHADDRGFFVETWNESAFGVHDLPRFVQDNEVFSRLPGTVRGLHYQIGAFAQAKLVRCLSGAILDVAVDLRRGSPTFGKHVAIELRSDREAAVFIPAGLAHGYCTLAPEASVQYKVSQPYAPAHEGGIAWDDPALAIDWLIERSQAIVSDRDRHLPRLADIETPFVFGS